MLYWIYNSNTGVIIRLPWGPAQVQLKSGLGWHGLFDSKEEAIAFYERGKAANPGWKAPTGSISGAVGNAADSAGERITDAYKGINLGGWVIRIGEIVLGIVLIGVGVAKLTGTTNLVAKALKVPL